MEPFSPTTHSPLTSLTFFLMLLSSSFFAYCRVPKPPKSPFVLMKHLRTLPK